MKKLFYLLAAVVIFTACNPFIKPVNKKRIGEDISRVDDDFDDSFEWSVQGSGQCSKSCGGGTLTRVVQCLASDGSLVSDSSCNGNKPATVVSCNTHQCSGEDNSGGDKNLSRIIIPVKVTKLIFQNESQFTSTYTIQDMRSLFSKVNEIWAQANIFWELKGEMQRVSVDDSVFAQNNYEDFSSNRNFKLRLDELMRNSAQGGSISNEKVWNVTLIKKFPNPAGGVYSRLLESVYFAQENRGEQVIGNILAHELGHTLLGSDHSDLQNNLMMAGGSDPQTAINLTDAQINIARSSAINYLNSTSGPSGKLAELNSFISSLAQAQVGEGELGRTGKLKMPTLVVGHVSKFGVKILTFGKNSKGQKPTVSDIYPISSISKMLTGLIAARGIIEGRFKKTTELRNLLKPDLARFTGERRIGHTVAHYASYRPNPTNNSNSNSYEPFSDYTRADLVSCLSSKPCSLTNQEIGKKYVYSNLSIGLLGLALMDSYGLGFEELLKRSITNDLKMSATHVNSSYYQYINNGLTLDGATVPPARMGALSAAGSVISNPQDMMKLLELMIRPNGQWQPIVNLATSPIQPGLSIGFAIDIINIDGMELYSKSGEQAGYSSLIMWSKLQNSGTFALTNLGMSSKRLADILIKVQKKMVELQR